MSVGVAGSKAVVDWALTSSRNQGVHSSLCQSPAAQSSTGRVEFADQAAALSAMRDKDSTPVSGKSADLSSTCQAFPLRGELAVDVSRNIGCTVFAELPRLVRHTDGPAVVGGDHKAQARAVCKFRLAMQPMMSWPRSLAAKLRTSQPSTSAWKDRLPDVDSSSAVTARNRRMWHPPEPELSLVNLHRSASYSHLSLRCAAHSRAKMAQSKASAPQSFAALALQLLMNPAATLPENDSPEDQGEPQGKVFELRPEPIQ